MKNNVQAFIVALSFPKTLDELIEKSNMFDVEVILGCTNGDYGVWTAPRWCKEGDVVFFYHTKNTKQKIRSLERNLDKDRYENYWVLKNCLKRAKALYDSYGGKIFAVGQIGNNPEYLNDQEERHWDSRIYAGVENVVVLERPISLEEFSSKIKISQNAITPVFGDDYRFLQKLVLEKNKETGEYFPETVAQPVPINKVDDDNWLEVLKEHRRRFFLESQFREFYVNRFLPILGGQKTIYRECLCKRTGKPNSWVDNIIKFGGKHLLVECKLSVASEKDIKTQLKKYANADQVFIEGKDIREKVYRGKVLVIERKEVENQCLQRC